METQDVRGVLKDINTKLAGIDRRLYGNGSGTKGVIERQADIEGRMGALERKIDALEALPDQQRTLDNRVSTLGLRQSAFEIKLDAMAERFGELNDRLKEIVPKMATFKGVPLTWWAILVLLAMVAGLILLLAGSKGLVDSNALAAEAAKAGRAVVESQSESQGAR